MPDNASISSPTQDSSAIAMRIASRGPRTAGSVEAAAPMEDRKGRGLPQGLGKRFAFSTLPQLYYNEI
jgi:hypothetical protein